MLSSFSRFHALPNHLQHFLLDIDGVDFAFGPDELGELDGMKPAAGAEVAHHLPFLDVQRRQ